MSVFDDEDVSVEQEDEILSKGWVVIRHKVTGKYWGPLYDGAYAKRYGWCESLDPYLIHDYKIVRSPEQGPYHTTFELTELTLNGVVCHVELVSVQ